MADLLWAWMTVTCGFLICIATVQPQSMRPELQAQQVYITRTLCGSTLDVGNPFGHWKRLLFPADTKCQGSFRCTISFRLRADVPLASDICVDYSRMQIQGRQSVVVMTDDAHTQRLTEERYPLIERYMNTVFCIGKQFGLHITFDAECSEPLDKLFTGWMYVFVQSSTTGSIYFVDGGGRHWHQMSARGQPRVSLRSHLWADVPLNAPQLSRMRLSVDRDSGGDNQVCLDWNPFVSPIVPSGVKIRVYKTSFNMELAVSTYQTLREGEIVKKPASAPNCYRLEEIYEMVVEVSRDADVPQDRSWNETELLLDLRLCANCKSDETGDTTTMHDSGGSAGDSDDNSFNLDENSESYSTPTFWEEHQLEICLGLGGLVLLVVLCCCCRLGCKHKEDRRGAVMTGVEDTPHSIMGPVDARETDAFPMMSRATPSAPSWHEVDENPQGVATDHPVVYDPPSYQELFPDNKRF